MQSRHYQDKYACYAAEIMINYEELPRASLGCCITYFLNAESLHSGAGSPRGTEYGMEAFMASA